MRPLAVVLVVALVLIPVIGSGCGPSTEDLAAEAVQSLADGNFARASVSAKTWAEKAPNDPSPAFLLALGGYISGGRGDWVRERDRCFELPDALSTLTSFLDSVPETAAGSPWILLARGIVAEKSKDREAARSHYERAASVSNHDAVKNTLSVSRAIRVERHLKVELGGVMRPAGGPREWILPLEGETTLTGKATSTLGPIQAEASITAWTPIRDTESGGVVGWGFKVTSGELLVSDLELKGMNGRTIPCAGKQEFEVAPVDFLGEYAWLRIPDRPAQQIVIPAQIHSRDEAYGRVVLPDDGSISGRLYQTGGGMAGMMTDSQGRPRMIGAEYLRLKVGPGSNISGPFGLAAVQE